MMKSDLKIFLSLLKRNSKFDQWQKTLSQRDPSYVLKSHTLNTHRLNKVIVTNMSTQIKNIWMPLVAPWSYFLQRGRSYCTSKGGNEYEQWRCNMYENERNKRDEIRNGACFGERIEREIRGQHMLGLAWSISWTLIVTVWAGAKNKQLLLFEYLLYLLNLTKLCTATMVWVQPVRTMHVLPILESKACYHFNLNPPWHNNEFS